MDLSLPQNIEQLQLPHDHPWTGAVNFLIVEDKVVFIKRSEMMPTHKGQIAFFGGHKHEDDFTPINTAFREFEEESGVSADSLIFLGLLHPIRTSFKHSIIPVLSRLELTVLEFTSRVKTNGEWTDMYLIGIDELTKLERWCFGNYHSADGHITPIVFFPFQDDVTEHSNLLWGATGKIVFNAVNILSKLK